MACQIRAQVMDWAGDHAGGLKLVERGLQLADSINAAEERTTLLIIGAELFLSQGDLSNAAEHLVLAERLARRIKFARGLAMIAINQGSLRFYQQRYLEALVDFKITASGRREQLARTSRERLLQSCEHPHHARPTIAGA
ncbi:MAG: hypothetical protein IPM68_19470 [Flavobacteriales bacterium]|nr:hypothetical protein [Flavobacteriales bacterium]